MNYLHISDTIQSSKDAFRHDTTVDRLRLWYEVLAEKLWLENQSDEKHAPEFVGSEFWNSLQTAAQAIALLEQGKFSHTQVVLVNNASRAKHTNSKNAKGSECLWAQVEIQGVTHHIVWVDDESFLFLSHFLKKGTKIQKIHSVNYTDAKNNVNIHIDDLSQGTQFRSKEHFPVVQLLLIQHLQNHAWELDEEALRDIFTIQPALLHLPIDYATVYAQKLAGILWKEQVPDTPVSELVRAYVEKVQIDTQTIVREGGVVPNYAKSYLPWFAGIEKVQLLWELALLREKFWIYTSHNQKNFDISPETLALYTQIRQSLEENQLILIDRDRFGNAIFAYGTRYNGIHSFVQKNKKRGFWFTDTTQQLPISLSGGGQTFTAYFTETISDLTGENCIWESSSRGPSGEKLLNINTSIGPNSAILPEVQSLPIGTVLTLTIKDN